VARPRNLLHHLLFFIISRRTAHILSLSAWTAALKGPDDICAGHKYKISLRNITADKSGDASFRTELLLGDREERETRGLRDSNGAIWTSESYRKRLASNTWLLVAQKEQEDETAALNLVSCYTLVR